MKNPEQQLECYLVGGAVRDRLLGNAVKDRDWVVVGATPQQMLDLGFKAVGKDFPVFLHPHTHEEYALARTERKTGPGYGGFSFNTDPSVTLRQDLARRDLTINAMAQTPHGDLVDYFGGAKDLKNRVLRHVSPAFAEDPVRILRVARFSARYGFDIADNTMELMREMVSNGEVDALVAERVWQELQQALAEPTPSRFFAALRGCGALARIFPEIDALFGVPQRPEFHPEIDAGVHTLMVVDQSALLHESTVVRFAALVHDLGKARTPVEALPSHPRHETTGVLPINELCDRLRVPKQFRELALLVCRLHLQLHQLGSLRAGTVVKLLEAIDAFRRPERVEQFIAACEADMRGRTGREHDPYPQGDLLLRCFNAAKAVETNAIVQEEQDGARIAELIRQARSEAVSAVLSAKNTAH